MLYLGGQTLYLGKEKKTAIFLTKEVVEDEKYIKHQLVMYDGDKVFNHSGNSVSHIFKDDPSNIDRHMYHGEYCNHSLYEPAYEADLKKHSKDIKKYLKDVMTKITKKKLFAKNF